MADPTGQSTPKIDLSTILAFDRTLVAYERTMLSWIRTATSLITFGFSIYKFFQIEKAGGEPNNHLVGPREFALAMVSIGLAFLVLATLEYQHNMRLLQAQYPGKPRSLALVVAALIAVLGLVALIAMIFKQ